GLALVAAAAVDRARAAVTLRPALLVGTNRVLGERLAHVGGVAADVGRLHATNFAVGATPAVDDTPAIVRHETAFHAYIGAGLRNARRAAATQVEVATSAGSCAATRGRGSSRTTHPAVVQR